MARKLVQRSYEGLAQAQVDWDHIGRIFDAIWGSDARSLPFFPRVIGGVRARWVDADGNEQVADDLDELSRAHRGRQTARISFAGKLEGAPNAEFSFTPQSRMGRLSVQAHDEASADRVVEIVREIFPLAPKTVFVSYATADF